MSNRSYVFNPINSAYYDITSRVLAEAVERAQKVKTDEPVMTRGDVHHIVSQYIQGESCDDIVDCLFDGEWNLMDKNGCVAVSQKPIQPLTLLEKQWLKTIAQDPRMRLFDVPLEELEQDESIEPLFELDWIKRLDASGDPDPWTDENYIRRFRFLLEAIRNHQNLSITWLCREGLPCSTVCSPQKLEYSMLDDKFRLQAVSKQNGLERELTINVSRITECHVSSEEMCVNLPESLHKDLPGVHDAMVEVTLIIEDKRQGLDRALLDFSLFQKKELSTMEQNHYRLTILIYWSDREEIVRRIISFGPLIRVESPNWLIEELKKRIRLQKNLLRSVGEASDSMSRSGNASE